MENMIALLTPLGQLVYEVILLVLVMSGIYYWWRRAGTWLQARTAKPTPSPEVLAERMRLRQELGYLSFSLRGNMDEVLALLIITHYSVSNPEVEARIRDAAGDICGATSPGHLVVALGSGERDDVIVGFQRIADALAPTNDVRQIRHIISLLRAAETLHKYEKAHNIVN